MAAPGLDPDQLLDDEDRDLLDDVASGEGQSGLGPVPDDIPEVAPGVAPTVAPTPIDDTEIGAVEGPVPADIAAPAKLTDPAAGLTTPGAEDIEKRLGAEGVERARIESAQADKLAAIATEADDDARLERADYLERRQQAEKDLDARTKAYESTKLQDPRQKNAGRAKLSVIFGGLGAAFRSAGGGDSRNYQLANLQQQWENDTEIQKANIAALRDQAIGARTRLSDIDEGRRSMMKDADARLLGKYNAAIKQGEAQLKAHGIPQAEIDADARIVRLRQARDLARAKALKESDAHALTQARIESLKAKAARDKAKAAGKGRGPTGPGGADAESVVAKHLIDNPGDIPGATQLASDLNLDKKRLDKVIANTKGTESQNRSAGQGAAGLRAVEALEKSAYKPSEDDVQKWLNNQRLVYGAKSDSIKGLGLTIGQNLPGPFKVPSSEVEGLSTEGKKYFGDVRRLMEPLGRAKSGAAISEVEWTNFFNQYGPQSTGGYAAARRELEDLFKLSGVAGRTLSSGGNVPGGKGPPSEADKLAEAKRIMNDPGDYSPKARENAAIYLKGLGKKK